MPVKKFVKRIAPAEEVEEVPSDDAVETTGDEIPVDPDDMDEVVEEGAEEGEEAPAPVAPPKKVVVAPKAAAPAPKPAPKPAAPAAKPAVAAPKAAAVKPAVKPAVAAPKPAAPKAVAPKPAPKPAAPKARITIGGKVAAPSITFKLQVGDTVLDVPGKAPEELGGRISREAFESAVHKVLVSKGLVDPGTTKKATSDVLKAIEETLYAVVSRWNLKFMGGMFKVRQISGRYYRPISEGRLGAYMPEHLRIKLDINAAGVKAMKGTVNDDGEFIETKAKKTK